MKKNMIETYYCADGQHKVEMDQDAARDIRIAIDAFRAGIELTSFNETAKLRLTGEYVADKFLRDECLKILAKENFAGCEPCSIKFLQAVEEKIAELL